MSRGRASAGTHCAEKLHQKDGARAKLANALQQEAAVVAVAQRVLRPTAAACV